MSDTKTADGPRSDSGSFGQPSVLANLFGVELWERFNYYGIPSRSTS